jgi:hypothetical protein
MLFFFYVQLLRPLPASTRFISKSQPLSYHSANSYLLGSRSCLLVVHTLEPLTCPSRSRTRAPRRNRHDVEDMVYGERSCTTPVLTLLLTQDFTETTATEGGQCRRRRAEEEEGYCSSIASTEGYKHTIVTAHRIVLICLRSVGVIAR